jgi:uncharacterized protein YsxB (DUF464 family)
MIEIKVYRDEEGRIQEIVRSGPDEQAPSSSKEATMADAGVTLLLRTAAGGLERYLKLNPKLESDAGQLRCQVERDYLLNREIDAILETALLGIKDLAQTYIDQVDVKEVPGAVKV